MKIFIKIRQSYKKLTLEQSQFIKSKRLMSDLTIPQWIAFFKPICELNVHYDKVIDKLDDWDDKLLWFLMLGSLGWFIVSFIIVFIAPELISIPFIIMLFIVLAYVLNKLLTWHYNKRHVDDDICQVITPFLELLSLDVGSNKRVEISINLNKPYKKAYLVRKKSGFFFMSNYIKIYKYPILELSCKSFDGTKMSLKINDRMSKRRKAVRRDSTEYQVSHIKKRYFTIIMHFRNNAFGVNTNLIDIPIQHGTFKTHKRHIEYRKKIRQTEHTKHKKRSELIRGILQPYQYLRIK